MENINYTWFIDRMQVSPNHGAGSNAVVAASWRCVGLFGELSGYDFGDCGLAYSPSHFTPYEQLTEQQVLEWCWASGVDKAAVEVRIADEIEQKRSPAIVVLPLPWAIPPDR